MINKIDKSLDKLTKGIKKKQQNKLPLSGIKQGTPLQELQMLKRIRKYYEQSAHCISFLCSLTNYHKHSGLK